MSFCSFLILQLFCIFFIAIHFHIHVLSYELLSRVIDSVLIRLYNSKILSYFLCYMKGDKTKFVCSPSIGFSFFLLLCVVLHIFDDQWMLMKPILKRLLKVFIIIFHRLNKIAAWRSHSVLDWRQMFVFRRVLMNVVDVLMRWRCAESSMPLCMVCKRW